MMIRRLLAVLSLVALAACAGGMPSPAARVSDFGADVPPANSTGAHAPAKAVRYAATPTATPTNPVPDWCSYTQTGNVACIQTAPNVAAAIGQRVYATNGYSSGQTLVSPVIPVSPSDVPGSTGSSVPNTAWVDKNYSPQTWFGTSNRTVTMCATGCTFSSILDFAAWINSITIIGDYTITLQISAGTYPASGSYASYVDMHGPNWSRVQILGAGSGSTSLNFNNLGNYNNPAFFARDGATLRFINSLTINGIGGRTGTNTWATLSAGAAFSVQGNAAVHAGGDIVMNDYYYDVLADVGGYFLGDAGVTGNRAGDVNFLARHGGIIHCENCAAHDAGDAPNNLGFNFLAESGGHMWADGSTATGGLFGGFCASASGTAWYHGVTATGGNGAGIFAFLGGILFADNAVSNGNATGVEAATGGRILAGNLVSENNTYDGFYIDYGYFEGSGNSAVNNGGYGANVIDSSWARFFNSASKFTGNAKGTSFVDIGSTCSSTSATNCHVSSSILISDQAN